MRALSCLLLQLVFSGLCIGGKIVIHQSRDEDLVIGDGTWEVIGIATVRVGGYNTFLCMTNDDNAVLRWFAMDDFTTISQSSVSAGQLLTISNTQESDIGEYVCTDTVSGDEARLNLTSDNPAVRAVRSTVVVEAGQRADLEVYVSNNNGRTTTVTWFKENQMITSNLFNSSRRLTLENVQLSNAGVYNITASIVTTGFYVLTNEAFITLIVYVRPALVTPLPVNSDVDEWSMVQLECQFTGHPVPQVTWHSSTGTISGVVTSNVTGDDEVTSYLVFDSISIADAIRYQCSGSNDYANVPVTSNTSITVTPRMILLHEGTIIDGLVLIAQPTDSLMLLCRSSGKPRWYTGNGMTLVTMETDDQVYQMQVDSVTQALNITSYNGLIGEYSCKNYDVGSPLLHRNITITTENPSVTTDNATLLYAVPGSSLQLVVNILGDPVPRADQIIWYRNDTLITIQDQQLIISHDRTQLTIMNVATQYYGVYRCNVMTNAGTRSQSFHIKRPFGPSAAIEPPSRTVTIGDRTYFTCSVDQGTPPRSIQWRHENDNLPNGVRDAHDVLQFDNVQIEHNGTYSCNVTNPWGSVVVFATLLVQVTPTTSPAAPRVSINNTLNTTQLSSGDNGPVLICHATGNPSPQVYWTYRHGDDDDDIPDGIMHNPVGTVAILTWNRPVRYTDAGLYQCVGSNSLGNHTATTYLTVTASPVITVIKPNPLATSGGSSNNYGIPVGLSGVIVSCTVFGVPLPDVHWVTANGLPLPDHVTSITSSAGSHDLNHVTAQLEWRHGFSSSDTGGYNCVSTNPSGNTSQTVTLTIVPELFIQLRILLLSCSHWQASSALTLEQVHNAILSSLHKQCQCQLDDNSLIDESLSCSEVDEATLYRAKLVSAGRYSASDVSDVIISWTMTDEPYITLNNTQYKIDTTCQVLVKSANQSECSELSNDDTNNSNNTLLYGVVGLGVLIVIFVILIAIVLLLLWRRRRDSSFSFSRTLCKNIRNTLYISNSFQAHLNQLGQSTITDRQIQANNYSATDELPHHYDEIKNFPNRSHGPAQAEQSPRLSSESRVTTDSGIHSRTHSCDRLTAQPSQSDVASSHASTHPSLARCEDSSLAPVHEKQAQTPIQHRQPSFDELRYMSGVKMIDNERSPKLWYNTEEQHISHSQPLEMIDSPNHNYVFSEQRSSYSQSSELSQSYPSVSHLQEDHQQQYKQPPEPYIEPVSFRSSLHSILGQSSQLDTMV